MISSRWRIVVVCVASTLALGVVAAVFWYEDLRYSLPTPRPATLVQEPRGASMPAEHWLLGTGLWPSERPVLLHFLNPACPCSRFNLAHLHDLQRAFAGSVTFVAVVQAEPENDAERAALLRDVAELELGMPTLFDPGGRIAAEAGVYSTPQAVVLDANGHLVYRGNYNTSRYCTDRRTEFVRIALEAVLATSGDVPTETPSTGCQLPSTLLSQRTTEP